MNSKHILISIFFTGLMICPLFAETLYVNSHNGIDTNSGTKTEPLKTIQKAIETVNNSDKSGPITIKVASGVYNLTKAVVIENERTYTKKSRLTIEATVLPDDSRWKPQLMPMILSTENPRYPTKPDEITETYGIRIKTSHVTIQGLKFLGSPIFNNMYAPIERIDKGLKDLLITQCMFIGDDDTFDIYCPAIATGDEFVVEHCIFQNCHASVVFWDGPESISGKNNAMRYCIVDGGLTGAWTCQTAEDFEFHHNIIARSEYFWMRKSGDQQKYRLRDCIVTDNKYYSGYGKASGPTGQTGAEVTYHEKNVLKTGEVVLVEDKRARHYLHPVPGTLGYDLRAGLFKKSKKGN